MNMIKRFLELFDNKPLLQKVKKSVQDQKGKPKKVNYNLNNNLKLTKLPTYISLCPLIKQKRKVTNRSLLKFKLNKLFLLSFP